MRRNNHLPNTELTSKSTKTIANFKNFVKKNKA